MNTQRKPQWKSDNWRDLRKAAVVYPLLATELNWHRERERMAAEIKRLRSEVGLTTKRYRGAQCEILDLVARLRKQPPPQVPERGLSTGEGDEEGKKGADQSDGDSDTTVKDWTDADAPSRKGKERSNPLTSPTPPPPAPTPPTPPTPKPLPPNPRPPPALPPTGPKHKRGRGSWDPELNGEGGGGKSKKTEEDQERAWAKTSAEVGAIRRRFVNAQGTWERNGTMDEWNGWYFGMMNKARSYREEEHQKPFWNWYEKEGEAKLLKAEEETKLFKGL